MRVIEFEITPKAPFSLEYSAWVLKRLPIDIMHNWDGTTLSRAVVVDGTPTIIHVEQIGSVERPRLHIHAGASKEKIVPILTRIMGLDVDLDAFYAVAAKSGRLAKLAERFRGLKPPRFPAVFESFVNAVANQQLSLHVGIKLLGKLSERYGSPAASLYTFPSPERLSQVSSDELLELGFSRNKAAYVIEMAKSLTDHSVDLESLQVLDDDLLIERLRATKGIGRWTAQYMLLRGYGRLNSFPIDDSGARARLIDYLGADRTMPMEQLERYVRRWQPYSGLLYFHLLLYSLQKKGAF